MENESAAALPSFFNAKLQSQYGAEAASRIIEGCSVTRATTFRVNTLKATRDEVASTLNDAGIPWQHVSWYDEAFIVDPVHEQALRELEIYHDGKIYLQSLSSMLPPLVLDVVAGQDVLDMCAAPGGKTCEIAALGKGLCNITACELHAPRAEKLHYNLQKQGVNRVNIMRTDARQLDDFFSFDRILLDAPCSGSGTLNVNDPKMPSRFTEKLIQKSCKSQAVLLDKALSLLKPGAILVYSTCSILGCENEDIVKAALQRAAKSKRSRAEFEIAPIELVGAEDLPLLPTSIEGSICVCPTELYEGFFMCKIKRVK